MYHEVGKTGLSLGVNFQSHKRVAAAKIIAIQHDTFDNQPVTRLIFDGIPSVTIADTELANRPVPKAGMYLIAYKDGYFSFHPGESFEEEYHGIPQFPLDVPASPNAVMRFFNSEHLPEKLREIAQPLEAVARIMDNDLPNSAEKSAGLRKLLEAKDCFVRAQL
jgi:hypothetical protein